MHLHDINTLLNLQGVTVISITEPIEKTVYVSVEPLDLHQPCPSCGNAHTIRHGKSNPRHVRHLDIWGNKTLLILTCCASYSKSHWLIMDSKKG